MIGRVNTGGGIKLPFRVIGGTTQPSNPKDGDIWVKTSVPIMRTEFANGTWASGGVGLVFLAGTLGGSNPTGTNTTVWAINKNTGTDKYILKITLTGCKQVQGSKGNWVNLDAYRYYGGKWVQFSSVMKIYGISRDITASSPAWARSDDAVGMTATASVGTAAGTSSFDSCYPWSDIKRETLATGDVMVKIPKFWFRRYRDGNIEHIKIADKATDGFTLHPAFKHGGVEVDHIYVGAYKTSSNNKSVPNASPQVNQRRIDMRSNAKNKGTGWSLIDISTMSAIQMLMLVEFADNNMQSKIGRGYCDSNSASLKTGSCDSVPNLTGRPAGTDGMVDVIWRGIEGFWGNVWEFVDGLNCNNGAYYVCNDISKYADDTATNYEQLSFTGATNWSSSYITEEGLDAGNNPHVIMPKAAGSGSESTYECDACWSSNYWRVFYRGGDWTYGSKCGLFAAAMNINSTESYPIIGSRLIYIPPTEV